MSGAFKTPDSKGVVTRSGYRFAIFLPARDGGWVVADRTAWDAVDPDAAETRWRAYAWPKEHGNTGSRTFFADSDGRILGTDDSSYDGPFPLRADAATPAPTAEDGAPDPLDAETTGLDGNVWKTVN